VPGVRRYCWSLRARLAAVGGVVLLGFALGDMGRRPAGWGLTDPVLLVLGTVGVSVVASVVLVAVVAGAATLDAVGVWIRGLTHARLVRWDDLDRAGPTREDSPALLLADGRVVELRYVLPPAEQRRLLADVAAGVKRRGNRPSGQAGRPSVWPARILAASIVGAGTAAALAGWRTLV
jgi:hypothetical protein